MSKVGKVLKKAAPVLGGIGGFMLGGPAGAALGAGLGTGAARGFKGTGIGTRMLKGGLAGFGAGTGLAGLGGLMGGTLGTSLSSGGALGLPFGNPLGTLFGGGLSNAGLAAKGLGSFGSTFGGGGGGNMLSTLLGQGGLMGTGGLPGIASMVLGTQGQSQALGRLGQLQDMQLSSIGEARNLAGLSPEARKSLMNQYREQLRAGQAERGIYQSDVSAAQEAELMPMIEQRLRDQQVQQLLGISGAYNPLIQSQAQLAGMY